MGVAHGEGIESTAAVLHHPLHPVAVALPIGTLIFALVADIVYLILGQVFWTTLAYWFLWAGIVTGAAAAALGVIDYLAITEVRRLMVAHMHAAGNVVALGLAAANLAVHWVVADPLLRWLPVLLSLATVGTLSVTGYLGGMLSYKYRIGQIAAANGGAIPSFVPTEQLLRHSPPS